MCNTENENGSKYLQILRQNGITEEISKIDIVLPNMSGEQFASVCELVTVQFKDPNQKACHLFAKKVLPVPAHLRIQKSVFEGMMINESYFLATIVQDLKRICSEKTGNRVSIDDIFPKTFYADKDLIVLENLTERGFKMLDKAEKQDFAHAKLVLETLAKYHAVSHALILEEGGVSKFLEKHPLLYDRLTEPEVEPTMSALFSPPFDMLLGMLKTSSILGSSDVYAKLEKFSGRWLEGFTEVRRSSAKSAIPVIMHGDCWNNNIFFSTDTAEENKAVFVDFQKASLSCPTVDIGCLIFTSFKSDVRKQWKELLQIYYAKFLETVRLFGINPESKFEDLLDALRRMAKVGFIFGLFLVVGMEALKTLDTNKNGFFGNEISRVMSTWIEENQGKADHIVAEAISLVQDFENLGGIL